LYLDIEPRVAQSKQEKADKIPATAMCLHHHTLKMARPSINRESHSDNINSNNSRKKQTKYLPPQCHTKHIPPHQQTSHITQRQQQQQQQQQEQQRQPE
jgi:hypothetical protein